MLEQRTFAMTDPAELRAVIDAYGWATMVTATPDRGLVVSHLPIVTSSDDLVIQGHLARADAALHELGHHDTVLVVQGPHGYVSPTSAWRLDRVAPYAHRIAGGVTGFRLVPDRVVGKAKLSQDKPAEDVYRVLAALDDVNPKLATAMRSRWEE